MNYFLYWNLDGNSYTIIWPKRIYLISAKTIFLSRRYILKGESLITIF